MKMKKKIQIDCFDSNGVEQFDVAYDMDKGHFTSNHANGENAI